MPTLTLIRGLPGSGKTTLAHKLGPVVYSADDYFMRDGVYEFDGKALPEAHRYCQDRTRNAIAQGLDVVVANTFTQEWEVRPYRLMGATVHIIDLYDAGLTDEELAARNVHGVPAAVISNMRARYEPLLIGTMVGKDRVVEKQGDRVLYERSLGLHRGSARIDQLTAASRLYAKGLNT